MGSGHMRVVFCFCFAYNLVMVVGPIRATEPQAINTDRFITDDRSIFDLTRRFAAASGNALDVAALRCEDFGVTLWKSLGNPVGKSALRHP